MTRRAHRITITLTAQAVGDTPPSLSEDMAPGGGARLALVDVGTAPRSPATFRAVLTEGGVEAAVWRLAAD